MPEPAILKLYAPFGKNPQHPLFIYFPGMDGSGELFGLQSAELKSHFDIRCLVIPGNDMSSWEGLAHQAVQLIRQEARTAPIYLCGESFGACLALRTIALAPALASHLILINSASAFHRFPWMQWVASITPWVAPPLYQSSTLTSLPVLANLSRIGEVNRQALMRAMAAVTQASTAWRLSLLSQFRLEPLRLHRVTAQTLLVASLGDRLLPSLEEAQRLATLLPNSRIYPLPHSGHVSLLEDGVNLGAIMKAVGFLPQVAIAKEPTAEKIEREPIAS
ncbi:MULTISPECIES: alpha/beta fold hydrolase [Cyanophyceae]|uniref:Alpha/beta hydrolase n=1 Tax=Leptolyngbya subtilissima DQ-A4 TaxID=2933933 RepID=A0ABV0K2N2_9CYAN|nr:alpha/beta fold hydrolase [Nodosilinea sp. FACHB-141]MBD2113011.1 alpha/beta fold hydrolase [Nodosilinea sp. FACHB-141]